MQSLRTCNDKKGNLVASTLIDGNPSATRITKCWTEAAVRPIFDGRIFGRRSVNIAVLSSKCSLTSAATRQQAQSKTVGKCGVSFQLADFAWHSDWQAGCLPHFFELTMHSRFKEQTHQLSQSAKFVLTAARLVGDRHSLHSLGLGSHRLHHHRCVDWRGEPDLVHCLNKMDTQRYWLPQLKVTQIVRPSIMQYLARALSDGFDTDPTSNRTSHRTIWCDSTRSNHPLKPMGNFAPSNFKLSPQASISSKALVTSSRLMSPAPSRSTWN